MADVLGLSTYTDQATWSDGTTKDTGDLRRKYNFGDRVSELAIPQDPFFRFVSKVAKKPTDDPEFKFTERRGSWSKRYAYVVGWVDASGVDQHGGSGDADIVAFNDGGAPDSMTAGDTVKVYLATDYKSEGNLTSIFSQSANKVDIGDSGTEPAHFLADQVIRIPLSSTDGGGSAGSDILCRIKSVTTGLTIDSRVCVRVEGEVVKVAAASLAVLQNCCCCCYTRW